MEEILGYAAAQNWLEGRHNHVKGEPGGSVYVPEDQLGNIWRIFDGRLSYSKGGLLLHMIRWELNDDEVFFEIMQEFTEQYNDSTATGEDFKNLVESISGQDFDDFFSQWYYGEGYPIFDMVWHYDDDSLYLNSTQTTSTNVTTLFKVTLPVHVKFEDGSDTTFRFFQDSNYDYFSAAIDQPVESIELDPEQWILHHLSSLLVTLEEQESPVQFYLGPNPAGDEVNVYMKNEQHSLLTVVISDITGRSVISHSFSGEKNTIDVSGLPSGIYMIRISDGTEGLTKRLIVK